MLLGLQEENKIKPAGVIFELEFSRKKPSYLYGVVEYFVDETYLKEKVQWLQENNNIAEFDWNAVDTKWIEIAVSNDIR
ncbi:hypothetical protein [Bacillus sp. T33-2]|uniref:hypothetical protein n=1 Tax=Bacillus sp. T33-2 TaxID=2054168 RepID=UPI000C76D8C2|nr:hypothetical protein [Bacillus sp. T33-2]PLR91658.1 hypothetical protein CVD19_21570 [Bacillus sp. T33-2]